MLVSRGYCSSSAQIDLMLCKLTHPASRALPILRACDIDVFTEAIRHCRAIGNRQTATSTGPAGMSASTSAERAETAPTASGRSRSNPSEPRVGVGVVVLRQLYPLKEDMEVRAGCQLLLYTSTSTAVLPVCILVQAVLGRIQGMTRQASSTLACYPTTPRLFPHQPGAPITRCHLPRCC